MTRLRKALRTLRPVDGRGIGGSTGKSWGGCSETIVYNEGREQHHCTGHKSDQQAWQHRCPCGFRWAK